MEIGKTPWDSESYDRHVEHCDHPYALHSPLYNTLLTQTVGQRRCSTEAAHEASAKSPPHKPALEQEAFPWVVELENSELWRQFSHVGTEMVITKNGRRMFPSFSVTVKGLRHDAVYSIDLEILPADANRYKFLQTRWVPIGRAEMKQTRCEYVHPDSPNTGRFWMEKRISFKPLKLTNNRATKHSDQIILNSMQKYEPHVHIRCDADQVMRTYSFPATQFIAVTAYQNSQITQMKIDHNPYARAFRESIPSDDGYTPERKGGHFVRCAELTHSTSPSRRSVARRLCRETSLTSPPFPSWETSDSDERATSVESGFESGDGSSEDLVSLGPESLFPHIQDNPYGNCQLNYWADDYSLYNPVLIVPPPKIISFSEPYFQQSTRSLLVENTVSPLKGLHGELHPYPADSDDVFM